MTATMKVKDLAAELGLSNKEVMQHLREIGVQAKSHMTAVDAEDVDKLRATLSTEGGDSEVLRREVQPGVIVRRRKARKGKAESGAAKEETKVAEEAPEAPAEVEEAPVAEEPAEAAAEKETPAEPVAEEKPKKAAKAETQKARIIKPAKVVKPAETEKAPVEEQASEPESKEEPSPAVEKTEAAEAESREAETGKAAEEKPADKPEKPVEPEVAAEGAKSKAEPVAPGDKAEDGETAKKADKPKAEAKGKAGDDEDKKTKKPKKKGESKVRIISMPDPAEVAKREAEKAAGLEDRPARGRGPRPGPGGRPGPKPGGRPGGARPAGRPGGGPGGGPAAPGTPPPPQPDGRSRKKRKKDRRVVEFSNFEDGDKAKKVLGDNRPGKGKRRKKSDQLQSQEHRAQPRKAAKRKIRIDDTIRLADMAHQMGHKAQDLIKVLFGLGIMATINQALDFDTATVVANEFDYEVENVSFDEQEFLVPSEADKPEDLQGRPPVVTIMGHVDHGKTSLLDAIRSTNVTDGEAGGITQHIGAYHVTTPRGEVVFLDTPGHEAFTTMRMRGAQVTDIVVLVVAADDGVMDQTREAIAHSQAAGVPMVVAVNKIDKEGANPDTVKRELAEMGLIPEDWGGETIFAHVSAKQRTGMDELLELILLQAEVLELKANPDKPARGHIVEAKLDKGRGPVGTMLIAEGTINQGDSFVCGVHHGKVRAMFNDSAQKIETAGPAMPVEIQGFDGVPEAGDEFTVVSDEKVARRIAQQRLQKQREKELAGKSKVTLESFLASRPDQEAQNLNLIVKADVQGSLEAVTEALTKLSTDEIKVQVVHGGAGAITESDILLASASEAIIIGFNVRPNLKVKEIAEQENVEVRFYDIIYKLVNEVKDAMSGMLAPDIEEVYLGQAEVRDTFSVPKVGTVAGCYITDGKVTRHAQIRLLRGGVVVHTGELSSLKRFKDDVKEVAKGYECGMGIKGFNDIKVGDAIEAFEEREVARTID
ncbi:translation initiation factor IF-2 [Desulfovibrio oxyclinae]|uniref:translation initiation factor IF-2 n=1 Tax=Desulfovibrio oxyclinae TaxID=63560 RepID=UPI00037F4C6B|nr:translation initiation factor IF-2 [Desulfovibrio oxyclinae]